MNRKISFSFFLTLVGAATPALAYDCYTDCGAAAEFRFPCPTIRNPRRTCTGRDPGTFAACEGAKAAACQVLEPLKDTIIQNMASAIAGNPQVQDEAKGWTTATCAIVGAGTIDAVKAAYSVPICAALSVAAAGCATFVVASGTVIVGATCAQLCTDKHLADCQ